MKRLLMALALSLAAGLFAGPFHGAPAADLSGTAAGAIPSAVANDPARDYFSDVVLVNQDGERMRFYSDLIEDKIVVISSFFTTCTSVCPVLNGKLAQVQRALGDRLGRDVYMISISVDPETDTVPKLKEYAIRYGAREGWFFLSGTTANVEYVLGRLGQMVDDPDNHSTILLVGNARTGLWKKVFGLADGSEIIRLVQEVVDDVGGELQ